jgi:hypothetical protein
MKKTMRNRLGSGILGIGIVLGAAVLPAEAKPQSGKKGNRPSVGRTGHSGGEHRRGEHRGGEHRRDERHGDRDRRSALGFRLGGLLVDTRRWVPGHYEVRYQRVLVRAGHYEHRRVHGGHGRPHGNPRHRGGHGTHSRGGRWVKVWVPPVYETRRVRVWVPGCYRACHAARRRPLISFGGIFRF